MTQGVFCYFYFVFVRRKNNKRGVVSIQIIAKIKGKSKLIKTIGSSKDPFEIEQMVREGKKFIESYGGQGVLGFSKSAGILKSSFEAITSHTEKGTELLLGNIFDDIGFNQINDDLFRKLVLSRITNPVSKLKTSDYLDSYKGEDYPVQHIYRYMDKLHSTQKEFVQQISYEHTQKVLGGQISVVFYDVTTLYFEIDKEDDLRKTGFSKEGKHQNPQIVLGLLVSKDGYPLAYDIFEGNKFEGHTMLPVIDSFKIKYRIQQLIIIADSGLLSAKNIEELQDKGYKFILGARIKNEKQCVQDQILNLDLQDTQSATIDKGDSKLIITYSRKRAEKDKHNRDRGLKKLERRIKSGKLTKAHINNRGYNKYLVMQGNIKITINKEKFNNDSKWDGLKGYLTNTALSNDQVIENYNNLWQIERAFRISKTDLKIRPVYHRVQRRIEAHICISFAAYKVFKELERQLKLKKVDLSAEKAINIAKTIYQIKAETNNTIVEHLLLLTPEQQFLANSFDFG